MESTRAGTFGMKVMGALTIFAICLMGAPSRSDADADPIEIFFSSREVEKIFEAQDWKDATTISYPGAISGDNLVSIKYLESTQELLVLFNSSDSNPQGDDLVLIAIDTDNDGDPQLDRNDYLFLVRAKGAEVAYIGADDDWTQTSYSGYKAAHMTSRGRWIVFWRIPIILFDGSDVGFMLGHNDEDHTSDFPLGASDFLPDSWGTLTLRQLSLSIIPERITYGESTTIEVKTHPPASEGAIILQYAKADSAPEAWNDITKGAPRDGTFSKGWYPPSAGVFNIRAAWDRGPKHPMSASISRELMTSKATGRIELDLEPSAAAADEAIKIKVSLKSRDAVGGNITLEFKPKPAKEWTKLQSSYPRNNTSEFIWRSIKAPGNYTLRALWNGDNNHLPANTTKELDVLPQLSEIPALMNQLESVIKEKEQYLLLVAVSWIAAPVVSIILAALYVKRKLRGVQVP